MSKNSSIFATLPGLEVPVSDIAVVLSRIWDVPASEAAVSPSEFRASQLNLIVHFGFGTEAADALEIFETTLRFTRRHPARIIILCPEDRSRDDTLITSKLFSECFIGKSAGDRSCCEVITLAYPAEGKVYLENQVSILLETDLPTYYWQHHFEAVQRENDYGFFMKIARRIVYDSRREDLKVRDLEWPDAAMVRDLSCASLLPVRQVIAQFLSTFSPEDLVKGLNCVRAHRAPGRKAEARCLGDWVGESLRACAASCGSGFECDFVYRDSEEELEIYFDYSDGRFFKWTADFARGEGEFHADLGRGEVRLPVSFKLLPLEEALSEALFL